MFSEGENMENKNDSQDAAAVAEAPCEEVTPNNTNIYEVEMQVLARMGTTKYVEAESLEQAVAVTEAWAENSFYEEWGFNADGPGECDDIDVKQLLRDGDVESA